MAKDILSVLKKQILYLDGGVGTFFQSLRLSEEVFRGKLFKDHPVKLKGNYDVLSLGSPEIVKNMHRQFLEAGSQIISSNTFSGTRISQADYALEDWVYELNKQSALLARQVAREFPQQTWVAGSIGPTTKTSSLSPNVSDPGFRNIDFDQLVTVFEEQITALMDGGVDLLLAETFIDTLNLKACLKAIDHVFKKLNKKLPLILSATITDQSGRILSGQTIEAFWNSIRHAQPLAVGLNCAFGTRKLKPFIRNLSQIADCFISFYPNAGLPNPLSESGYDETPEETSQAILNTVNQGHVNLVGGCCGTTAEHIRKIIEKTRGKTPRVPPTIEKKMRLSGLEAHNFDSMGKNQISS